MQATENVRITICTNCQLLAFRSITLFSDTGQVLI